MIATRWVDEGNAEQQRAEWEANWFAAGFLMPETVFRAQWHASGNVFLPRTMRMAKFFDLSESAIEIRAKSLALT
jgi:Zn-dependent peptidase ImmA (M78 family)